MEDSRSDRSLIVREIVFYYQFIDVDNPIENYVLFFHLIILTRMLRIHLIFLAHQFCIHLVW
jgi:hypothetical protein